MKNHYSGNNRGQTTFISTIAIHGLLDNKNSPYFRIISSLNYTIISTIKRGLSPINKRFIIEWSPDLRDAIEQVMRLRRKILSVWLFHTNRGQPYIKNNGSANGFDSIWQRFIRKALDKTNLKERFTEHDLRAKVASDTESLHAMKLLGHSNSEITERIYRRKAYTIKPTK